MVWHGHVGRASHKVMGARIADDRGLRQRGRIELARRGSRYPGVREVRLRVSHVIVG